MRVRIALLVVASQAAAARAQPQPQLQPPVEPAEITDPGVTNTVAATPSSPRGAPVTVRYRRGRGLTFELPHRTTLGFHMFVEPLARYSHESPPSGPAPDDTVDLIIRRARFGFELRAPHDLGFRFDTSVKNMHAEIHNMYGFWKPRWNLELQVGFIKAPGGLERDSRQLDHEFVERSVITFYNRDHEVGVQLAGTSCDERWRFAGAITRDPPPLEGGDPEDTPQIPSGVEAEDLFRAASKWAAEARAGFVPSRSFEASVNAGVRLRPDEPDFGEIAVEPYDTTFLTNRPYRGTMVRVGGDVAIARPHWKLLAEAAFRRDGEQLAYPDGTVGSEVGLGGHLTAEAAYLVAGWTPNGEWGPALATAPLRRGWALVTRLMAERVKPVDADAASFASVELGWHWEAAPNLRVQVDMAIEKFGDADVTLLNENKGGIRVYGQTWAVFRL